MKLLLVLFLSCLLYCIGCPITLEDAPCPCLADYYCCRDNGLCVAHNDPSCFASDAVDLGYHQIAQNAYVASVQALAAGYGKLFVADRESGLLVFATSSVGDLTLQHEFRATGANTVAVLSSTVAVLGLGDRVLVLGLADLDQPLAEISALDSVKHIATYKHFIFLSEGAQGVRVFDLRNPAIPLERVQIASLGATPRGGQVFFSGAEQTVFADDQAFIADGDGGLHVLDVFSPAAPRHLSRYPENRFEIESAVSSAYATPAHVLLADRKQGLLVLDRQPPLGPQEIGRLNLTGYRVWGDTEHALLAVSEAWLVFVDLRDPVRPVATGGIDTRAEIRDFVFVDGHIYVATHSGLQVWGVP